MRLAFFLALMVLHSANSTDTLAAGSILGQLRLGVTTPEELEKLFPGTRTEIPKGDGQRVVHFEDAQGSSGVCRFYRNRLFKYTVRLSRKSPVADAVGAWDRLLETGTATFGPPRIQTPDSVTWDLRDVYFSISREVPQRVTVTLCGKRLEEIATGKAAVLNREPVVSKKTIYGGPYFLKGFQPDLTRKIKLTQGIYDLTLRHKGRHYFGVWMHWADGRDLVASGVGHVTERKAIRVDEDLRTVFFAVENADGPWEIEVRKVRLDQ